MSSTQDKIRGFYSGYGEDKRHSKSRANGMEFRHTKLLLDPYISPDSEVVEFGCATGYYAEHWHDKCKSYLGVDIVQNHVDFFNAKNLSNARAQLGDATRCPELPDNAFDVVLCLGPMYHLPAEERAIAMAEMARILKPGGVAAFAFVNKIGVLLWAMTNRVGNNLLPWYKRRRRYSYYSNRRGNEAVFAGVNDVDNPFFFTMPEELETLATACGLRLIQHAGVDIVPDEALINRMDEEQYACWLEFAEYMLRWPSVAGAANHGLMICRKG